MVIFARNTVDFAPMLMIFFIAALTLILQTGLKNGASQRLAQTCFYECTAAVAGQKLLALIMLIGMECELLALILFFCMEFECQETYTEDNVVFAVKHQTDEMVIIAIQRLGFLHILVTSPR